VPPACLPIAMPSLASRCHHRQPPWESNGALQALLPYPYATAQIWPRLARHPLPSTHMGFRVAYSSSGDVKDAREERHCWHCGHQPHQFVLWTPVHVNGYRFQLNTYPKFCLLNFNIIGKSLLDPTTMVIVYITPHL
jgi:hypothetical protein